VVGSRLVRRLVFALVVLALAGCGGGERQGAGEPSGEFRVQVVRASFPRVQHVAERVQLRLRVRNADQQTLPTVAVSVETKAKARGNDATVAFGQNQRGADLSSAARPVWVLDEGPHGGDTAYDNTWIAGRLKAGESRELTWSLVASKAGTYTITYNVFPGLTGKATAAGGRSSGSFTVRILDEPVPARVGEDGKVERGVEAGAG
jgi:hypothetical protein